VPEVEQGVINADEYEVASVYKTRLVSGWQVLTRHGLGYWIRWNRYVQLIVDLAYKKHQKRAAGEGQRTDKIIAELRQRIADGRAKLARLE